MRGHSLGTLIRFSNQRAKISYLFATLKNIKIALPDLVGEEDLNLESVKKRELIAINVISIQVTFQCRPANCQEQSQRAGERDVVKTPHECTSRPQRHGLPPVTGPPYRQQSHSFPSQAFINYQVLSGSPPYEAHMAVL